MYEKIPQELKDLKQWCCWKGDKIPKNGITGNNAKSNDSTTWCTFEEAIKGKEKYQMDGIGFFFANGYFGVDLDHVDFESDFVDEFVETLQSYNEYSRSHTGIHIICKGKLPDGGKRKNNVEMYQTGRFFIMTGDTFNGKYTEIRDCTDSVKFLHNKYIADERPQVAPRVVEPADLEDREVIDKARNCRTGSAFQMLYSGNWEGIYNSQSEADLKLCNILAFWTQRNKQQMDRIFRTSGLYRDKWDKKRGTLTYGEITLEKAISGCLDVYEPHKQVDDSTIALGVFGANADKVANSGEKYDQTDTGNAKRFADKYRNNIRYSFVNKCWYYWTGKVWNRDRTGEIKKLADTVIDDIKLEAFSEQDDKSQEDILKWATKTASSKGKENFIKETQHLDGIPILPEEMDRYEGYLNTPNGVVNLRNGELTPHDSKLNISKITFSEFENDKQRPEKWMQFLNDIFAGDGELIEYIQKCVGYSLTGSIKEQCCFFLYGQGRNGKSTFLNTVQDMLGTYACNIQPETIMVKKNDSTANSDIARLKSMRMVCCEEGNEDARLNEGLIKQLTGGGKMTCRFLYGEEFEYEPEFKLWFATNHPPKIYSTDLGIWRRMRIIPFEVTIEEHKVNKNLKYELKQEMPQILNWAIEGCIKYFAEGLKEPERVVKATNEYKTDQNMFMSFFENCLMHEYNAKNEILKQSMYEVFQNWAKKMGYKNQPTINRFNKEMFKIIGEDKRKGDGMYFVNIKYNEYGESLKGYKASDFN